MKKKKEETRFDNYIASLPETDTERLAAFFTELDRHNALSKDDKIKLRTDFEDAFLRYANAGIPLGEAMSLLDTANLGGFYARPPKLWFPLDDAAKVYPLSMKHDRMAVFRISVYLKEEVLPEILQIALTFTIKRFPSFATTLKKGFFWHYLDTSKRVCTIEQERGLPCRPMPISRSGSQSFRVLYYKNRISCEYFHILTDGTGGMVFLKTLVAEYMRLLGVPSRKTEGILDVNATPTAGETANEFPRAESKKHASGFVDKAALQLSGKLARRMPCRVLHFKMNAALLHTVASDKYNTTVTAYVLAVMFVAAKHSMDEASGNVSIQVPVNMRKFYPSETLKNFSMYCGVKFPLNEITDVPSMLAGITEQLATKASNEAMSEMMNATEKLVNSVRYVPLFIKTPVAKLVYGFLGDRIFTSTISNLGVVKLPPEIAEHVLSMDFVLGTTFLNRAICSMVTFGNVATLTVSKMTSDPSFEEAIYRGFAADGITAEIEGSELYEH